MDQNLTQTQQGVTSATPPNVPPVQAPKDKKSLLLMITIYLVVVAVIGYFVYQNIQLDKQISQPQPTPSIFATPTSSTTPTTFPKNTTECSGNDKYSILIKEPSSNSTISEFLVKYSNGGADFNIREMVAYCIELENNFLILDAGTSAGPRSLIIYDLDKKSKIYEGKYVRPEPVISNNTISYWEPSSEVATVDNCPNFSYHHSMGGRSAIDVYVRLNLITLKKELLGQQKCDYRE